MPTYYLDCSATYNGDGSATNQAASDTSAGTPVTGAANNLLDIIGNTHVNFTLTEGDTIHVRSHDGTNDIEVMLTSNVATTDRTYTAPLYFEIDDGTIWSGDDGHFTVRMYNTASDYSGYSLRWPPWMQYLGKVAGDGKPNAKFIFGSDAGGENFTTNAVSPTVSEDFLLKMENIWLEWATGQPNKQQINGWIMQYGGRTRYELKNFYVDAYLIKKNDNNNQGLVFSNAAGGFSGYIDGLTFYNVSNHFISTDSCHLFVFHQSNCTNFRFIDCDFTDFPGEGHVVRLTNDLYTGMGVIDSVGCDFGNIKLPIHSDNTTYFSGQYGSDDSFYICLKNFAGGAYNFQTRSRHGESYWYAGGSFPVITGGALLPDGTTNYSVRCLSGKPRYPAVYPACLARIEKYYTGSEVTKTLSVEMLFRDTSTDTNTFDSLDKYTYWMDVTYKDSSGTIRRETSRGKTSDSLGTSTTTWTLEDQNNKPVYNSFTYKKHKVELTTAYAIDQNSYIYANVYTCEPEANINANPDYIFINPDIDVT